MPIYQGGNIEGIDQVPSTWLPIWESICGRKAAIAHLFIQDLSDTTTFNTTDRDYIDSHGSTILVTMGPSGAAYAGSIHAAVLAGTYDSLYRYWAQFFEALAPHPVLVRFMHEANLPAGSYAWSKHAASQSATTFKNAFRRIWWLLKGSSSVGWSGADATASSGVGLLGEEVDNIKVVYGPASGELGTNSNYFFEQEYPGAAYCDLWGLDGYCQADMSPTAFTDMFDWSIKDYLQQNSGRGSLSFGSTPKPIMIVETGINGGGDDYHGTWGATYDARKTVLITRQLTTDLQTLWPRADGLPAVRHYCYFDTLDPADGSGSIWRLQADDRYEAAYALAINVSFYKESMLPNGNATVSTKSPAASATDVAIDTVITAAFDRPMVPESITTTTFKLREDGAGSDVPATVSYDAVTETATLTPTSALDLATEYDVTVVGGSSGVKGVAFDDQLAADSTWSFTTLAEEEDIIMASFAYTYAAAKLGSADLDLNGHDIRVMLCMTNTTADTEKNIQTISGFATLDEYDGANYVRKTLASEAVNVDTVNLRGEFDAADFTWTALGAGTRSAQGLLVFRFITNDADSIPIAWIDSGGFPFAGNGGDVPVVWNAEGILQLQA